MSKKAIEYNNLINQYGNLFRQEKSSKLLDMCADLDSKMEDSYLDDAITPREYEILKAKMYILIKLLRIDKDSEIEIKISEHRIVVKTITGGKKMKVSDLTAETADYICKTTESCSECIFAYDKDKRCGLVDVKSFFAYRKLMMNGAFLELLRREIPQE